MVVQEKTWTSERLDRSVGFGWLAGSQSAGLADRG